jgi:hypothetical protein
MFTNFKSRFSCAFVLVCLLIPAAWGDSLELKNGSLIKGKYLGGTENEISFQVGSTIQRYAVADVVSVGFDASSHASAPQGVPHLGPRPALQPSAAPAIMATSSAGSVTVPVGTMIMIRTIDAVDSDRNQVGDRFQASLDQPLIVNGTTVVPKGADVYGRLTQAKEAGKIAGRSELKLELTGIVVNGQTIPLVTGDYSVSGGSRGASTAKRVGGGAAIGAAIGAIAGGGKGAAIGAGVGAGAGTAVQVMTKGEQVHVPSETLLEFSLRQEVRMPVASGS